jgi:low temperature requirement protein LtrA
MTKSTAAKRPIATREDQSATFIELFFDLVFVFSVTQVVGILHHGLSWIAIGQAVLVFWLVWWAWTQFTWALNSADTTHPKVELGTLVATALAFFMAIAVPEAFEARALWFAIAYGLVRTVGLVIFSWVIAEQDAKQ